LELLPDDRLLCNDGFEIILFDLRDAPVSTLIHDSIRFSVLTREGVKGLIVSRIRNAPGVMGCVDLFILRIWAMILQSCEPTVLQYAWPNEQPSAAVSQANTIQVPYCSELLFDGYSTISLQSTIESILDLEVAL